VKKLLFILVGVLLFSCKDDEGNVLEEVNSDCVTLNLNQKICKISQTKIHYSFTPIDTLILSYTYKGNTLDKTFLSIVGYSANLDSSIYLYNASDQLYAVLKTNLVTNKPDTFERYSYNLFNQLTEALFYSNDGSLLSKVKLTYSNCKLTKLFAEYPTITTSEEYEVTVDENDNIVDYKLTERDGHPSMLADSTFFIEYDNKVNPSRYIPSRHLPDSYFPTRYLSTQNFNPFIYFSENNITRYKVLKNNTPQLDKSIQYTYNQDALPIKAIETEDSTTITTWFSYNCN